MLCREPPAPQSPVHKPYTLDITLLAIANRTTVASQLSYIDIFAGLSVALSFYND